VLYFPAQLLFCNHERRRLLVRPPQLHRLPKACPAPLLCALDRPFDNRPLRPRTRPLLLNVPFGPPPPVLTGAVPTQEQLVSLQEFVSEYSSDLLDISNALDHAVTDVWDPFADPIALNVGFPEHVRVRDLVQTDNKYFYKIVTVFSVLCWEVTEMKEKVHPPPLRLTREAEKKFYGPLALFGETLSSKPLAEGDDILQVPPPSPSAFLTRADLARDAAA
jgi:hypothetical protein